MSNPWQEVPGAPGILRALYTVPGTTPFCTLIDLGSNTYLIYSPGVDLETKLPANISNDAKLLLLAPCTGHNLGLQAWLEKFPDAQAFSMPGVKERLVKKKRPIDALRPVEELTAVLPEHIQLHVLPENKFHEVWISVDRGNTSYWMFGDAILNFETLEGNFILKFLLGIYGIKEGLNLHKMFLRGLKDKQAFKQWALPLFDNGRDHILLPCHRESYTSPDCTERMINMLNELR